MPLTIAIIGAGRLGHTLARALSDAGHDVRGPSGRGSSGAGAELVLLCDLVIAMLSEGKR